MRDRVREFLGRFFRGHDLGDDEDIFATGYVNEMFAQQLVRFVETEFDVEVESEDLEIDNFRTVNAIVAFVCRKRGEAAEPRPPTESPATTRRRGGAPPA